MTGTLGRGQARAGRRGFTLLELVVAVVVMGLLSAVAITTGNRVLAKSHDASAEATVRAFAKEASALARLEEAFSVETLLAAGSDLHLGAAEGTWAGSNPVVVGGPTKMSEAVWGTVYVQVSPDGQVAGIAATSRSGNCVRAQVGYPWDTDVFTSEKPLGLNCSAGEAVKGAPGVDAAGNPTGAADFFDDGTPFAAGYVALNPKVHRIDVTWEVSTRAERYVLSRATSPEGPFTELTTTTSTSYQDIDVSIYEEYHYRVVVANEAGSSPAVGGPARPLPETSVFNAKEAVETFTVPAGVTRLTVVANGGQGGRGDKAVGPQGWDGGGYGGTTTATFDVTPGEVFSVAVGGRGGDANPSQGGDTGWGLRSVGGYGGTGIVSNTGQGGTLRAGGGGGATEVFRGTGTGMAWLLTAGGGGGCGYDPTNASSPCSKDTYGGSAGGDEAGDGSSRGATHGGTGGGPGAGVGGAGATRGDDATGGRGGNGATLSTGYPGGGGGGGCFGGGGGGAADAATSTSKDSTKNAAPGAGGGGGTGCLAPGVEGTTRSGTHRGDGTVTFTW